MYHYPFGTAYVSWQLTSIRLPHSAELITFAYGKSISSNYGRQQVEPAVRFHHIYEVDGDPEGLTSLSKPIRNSTPIK